MYAYSELYLNDAKQNLAVFFDYMVCTCGLDGDFCTRLFVQSGYADKFERGNPAIIAGMSGIELARRVLEYAYPHKQFPPSVFSPERSAEYWVGWALAEYQWITCKRFKSIFSRISFPEIRAMYRVYHEMDIIHFIEDMDTRYREVEKEPQLKVIRESHGLSQRELAELSGVKLRSIQMYEQKVNNIDKAQAGTVYKLSRVLGCTVEDLLENPEM